MTVVEPFAGGVHLFALHDLVLSIFEIARCLSRRQITGNRITADTYGDLTKTLV